MITHEIIDGEHGLGAQPSPPDNRDRMYRAVSRFGSGAEEPARKHRKHYTQHTRKFDQGPIGQCTMYSLAHIVSAGPITQRPYRYQGTVPEFDTIAAYCRGQELDKKNYGFTNPTFCQSGRVPGSKGDTGVTMRSAAQVGRELGYLGNFWWLENPEQVRAYLTNLAPVWFASWWWSGMNRPDANGFVHPTGRRRGGHAYVLDEIVWSKRYVWMLNSWGNWGILGRAKISFDALDFLFEDWGEALGLTELRKAA